MSLDFLCSRFEKRQSRFICRLLELASLLVKYSFSMVSVSPMLKNISYLRLKMFKRVIDIEMHII